MTRLQLLHLGGISVEAGQSFCGTRVCLFQMKFCKRSSSAMPESPQTGGPDDSKILYRRCSSISGRQGGDFGSCGISWASNVTGFPTVSQPLSSTAPADAFKRFGMSCLGLFEGAYLTISPQQRSLLEANDWFGSAKPFQSLWPKFDRTYATMSF
jgi:hypothetical protein